ncbi:hypothetical protein CVT24_000865 [Panaeolus cyanescens]|uniref:Prenylcysteine lyase domain-containing protein n=1 Tax=Panaeolus cyanescens TaxID=181874 RepID=A0A409WXX2_9AGAR|nr:hypothetical protein CVT24_000865 [Panaeolus cyanescens]
MDLLRSILTYWFILRIFFFTLTFRNALIWLFYEDSHSLQSRRIAVIGAGVGGTSAAFWISGVKENIQIDLYERSFYIGGNSQVVYPYHNHSLPPVELGAWGLNENDQNMWRAFSEFNLTLLDNTDRRALDHEMVIWDGRRILFWPELTASNKENEALTSEEVLTMTSRMGAYLRRTSVKAITRALQSNCCHPDATRDHLSTYNISSQYISSIIETALQASSGQTLNDVNAVQYAFSMTSEERRAVDGGTVKIFIKFAEASGANVYLNTNVYSVQRCCNSQKWVVFSDRGRVEYDAVILAAPYHSTGITLPPEVLKDIPLQTCHDIYSTVLVTSSASLNRTYFGLSEGVQRRIKSVLTQDSGMKGSKKEFYSIQYVDELMNKFWSKEGAPIRPVMLQQWPKFYKQWRRCTSGPEFHDASPKLSQGLYNINAVDGVFTNMEMHIEASRDVVEQLTRAMVGVGICDHGGRFGRNLFPGVRRELIYGWDCL